MSLLKKFRKLLLGEKKPSGGKIKVTEVSPQKSQKTGNEKSGAGRSAGRPPDGDRRSAGERGERAPASSAAKGKSGEKSAKNTERRRGSKAEAQEEKKPGKRRDTPGSEGRRRRGSKNEDNVPGVNPDAAEETDFGPWSIDEFTVEAAEGKLRFHDLSIPDRIMRGIQNAGYEYATPIQALILPEAFKGTDVSGKAQTGTGKTAAFLITVFRHLLEKSSVEDRKPGTPRALIMAPTRELVIQIEKDARIIGKYTGLNIQSVFGGINYEKQRRQVENRRIDVLAATPGRLLDFKNQGVLSLDKVEILVIDEADRMLDMGFIPDMRKIINATPPKGRRQTMLFSATLSPEILRLASQWTKDPLSFEVESKEVTADAIEQRAYIVTAKEKFPLMYNMIKSEGLNRVIVFGNRRDEAARLAEMFKAAGISCGVLSGDVSQARRIRTLEDLREGRIAVLAATDVAARGIHVDDITHVFNYTLPDDPEDYVHRIGRTGRAGATGVSVIFATEEDAYVIPQIEQFTGHKLNYINPEPEMTELPEEIARIMPSHRSFSRPRGITRSPRSGGGKSMPSGPGSRSGRPLRRSGR